VGERFSCNLKIFDSP